MNIPPVTDGVFFCMTEYVCALGAYSDGCADAALMAGNTIFSTMSLRMMR
jgi:hypothetical protein